MSNLDTTTPISEIEVDGVVVPMTIDGITGEIDPTVPQYIKNITEEDINNWNNKAEKSEIPTKVSELENDSGYLKASSETITTMQSNISSNINRLDGVANNIISLTQKDEQHQNMIDAMWLEKEAVRTDITNLQTSDNEQDTAIANLEAKIPKLTYDEATKTLTIVTE